jgi:hypothetical protein
MVDQHRIGHKWSLFTDLECFVECFQMKNSVVVVDERRENSQLFFLYLYVVLDAFYLHFIVNFSFMIWKEKEKVLVGLINF